ncbi:uncharacterized protein [Antedon mediterranea]|uniref:uncharacterized protein n=1 Tax=Antedon mediterranea TaxID=105859 RepID=UPI003AF9F185
MIELTEKHHILFAVISVISYLLVVEGKAPVGEWTVTNQAGRICMKMKMGATLTIPYSTSAGQTTADVYVPTSASPTDYSKCEGDSVSFSLKFFMTLSNYWTVGFDYKKSGSQYQLDKISVGYTYDEHLPGHTAIGFASSSISNSDLPKTNVGNYYGCDNVTFDVSGVKLALSNVKFQPYVQDVTTKDFGELQVCTTSSGMGEVVAILIIIAVALVIIVPIVVTIVFVVRRKRRNRQFNYHTQQ